MLSGSYGQVFCTTFPSFILSCSHKLHDRILTKPKPRRKEKHLCNCIAYFHESYYNQSSCRTYKLWILIENVFPVLLCDSLSHRIACINILNVCNHENTFFLFICNEISCDSKNSRHKAAAVLEQSPHPKHVNNHIKVHK